MKCLSDELRVRGDFQELPWREVLGEEFCAELVAEAAEAIAAKVPARRRNKSPKCKIVVALAITSVRLVYRSSKEMYMTYTITQKLQQAIPAIFGGGVRYRFVLQVAYPNVPTSLVVGKEDGITSDVTVELGTFVDFEIGDKIKLNLVTAHE